MISLNDAKAQGIERVRKPIWENHLDHLHIAPYNTFDGIWTHLYCPFNKECNGRDPVEILKFQIDVETQEWEPYTGALPDSDEYKAAVAFFAKTPVTSTSRGKT